MDNVNVSEEDKKNTEYGENDSKRPGVKETEELVRLELKPQSRRKNVKPELQTRKRRKKSSNN